MENFTFSLPTEIFFGKAQIKVLGEEIRKHGGSNVLICYGSDRIKENKLFTVVTKQLKKQKITFHELNGIQPNPRISRVRDGIQLCKEHGIDFLLAIGGGSVIDSAKAIAAGYYYDGDPRDFFIKEAEVAEALPLATVLTLAATGSEMNGNGVISNLETQEKRAVGSPLLLPRFSILDPEYTFSVPPNQTAAGIVDIMSHVFAFYFCSAEDTYLQSSLADAILRTVIHYGPVVLKEPKNYVARANILWAGTLALNGLLSFGQPGDRAVHAIEHAVCAVSDITHGVGLAILTPCWMEYVLSAATKMKFYSLSVNIFGALSGRNDTLTAKSAIIKTREFFSSLGMPTQLSAIGVAENQLETIAQKTVRFGKIGTLKELAFDDV
ncbi:NADH-dependent alcohol dehydrogenase, partial [Methanosarcinales archaeon]